MMIIQIGCVLLLSILIHELVHVYQFRYIYEVPFSKIKVKILPGGTSPAGIPILASTEATGMVNYDFSVSAYYHDEFYAYGIQILFIVICIYYILYLQTGRLNLC